MKPFKFSHWSCIQTGLLSIAVAVLMSLTAAKPSYAAPVDDYFTAIKNDNDGAVVTLLFRGLDVNTVDAQGRHGLQIALAEGSLKVAKKEKVDKTNRTVIKRKYYLIISFLYY